MGEGLIGIVWGVVCGVSSFVFRMFLGSLIEDTPSPLVLLLHYLGVHHFLVSQSQRISIFSQASRHDGFVIALYS